MPATITSPNIAKSPAPDANRNIISAKANTIKNVKIIMFNPPYKNC